MNFAVRKQLEDIAIQHGEAGAGGPSVRLWHILEAAYELGALTMFQAQQKDAELIVRELVPVPPAPQPDELERVGLALGTNGQFQGLLAGGTAYPHANAVLNVLAERDSLRARLAGIVPCETFSESECPKDGCKHCGWSEEAHYPEPIDAFSDWLTIDVSFKQGIVSDGATYVCAAYPDSIGVWTAYGGEALTPQPMWWFPYPEMPQ